MTNKQQFIDKKKYEYLKKIEGILENVLCKSCGRFNKRHSRMCRSCGSELRPD